MNHRASQLNRFLQGRTDCPLSERGVEVGDGWQTIVDGLLTDLEAYCAAHLIPLPRIVQMKQKFGTLRVYWRRTLGDTPLFSAHDEVAIRALIAQADDLAQCTCETCGAQPAAQHWVNGYLEVCCSIHHVPASSAP
uniref:Uncharacterized protein n=1 Tax=mine drainage metagenome TaxID=410659 RepID=E6PQ15_9ZZZZ